MNLKRFVISGAILLLTCAAVFADDEIQKAFEQGLIKEEAEHNLNGAIQAYQSVLTQLDGQRKIAASTIFRLGECYRKLGNTNDAIVQYQRVVREFSDQATLVLLSNQNLMALGSKASGAGQVQEQVPLGISSEEAKEIESMKRVLANSPDLVNSFTGEGHPRSTHLQNAASKGWLELTRFLLQKGADVNFKGQSGSPPLVLAASSGHKAIVDLLLNSSADINATDKGGNTALHLAASSGYRTIVETLLKGGADITKESTPYGTTFSYTGTPLHMAAFSGDIPTMELLLKRGAKINAVSLGGIRPLHMAIRKGSIQAVEFLLKNGADINAAIESNITSENTLRPAPNIGNESNVPLRGFTGLHLAIFFHSEEIAKLLIAKGGNVNALAIHHRTPLSLAVEYNGSKELVKTLLDAGADPNLSPDPNAGFAFPILTVAVRRTDPEIVTLLLQHKADIEALDNDGYTPLQRAVLLRLDEIAKILLNAGANPNVKNQSGFTPLHWAVEAQNPVLVDALIAHHADLGLSDNSGKTPLDWAKTSKTSGIPMNAIPGPQSASSPSIRGPSVSTMGNPQNMQAQIIELLQKAGGPETGTIALSRQSSGYQNPIIVEDSKSFNRHSLYELIAMALSIKRPPSNLGVNNIPFASPDFSQIQILRPSVSKEFHGQRPIPFDLREALKSGDCSKNVWLELGDTVEIPVATDRSTLFWRGISEEIAKTLQQCLQRTVEVKAGGKNVQKKLVPSLLELPAKSPPGIVNSKPDYSLDLPEWKLSQFLRSSDLLSPTSDLTHVKVKRVDPVTKENLELAFDLNNIDPRSDLVLLDGDIIEVPEKK